MGEVSVTIESLKNAKKTLMEFQMQVRDVVIHALNHGESVLAGVKESLRKQRKVIEQLIEMKEQIQENIEECQKNIDNLTKAVQNKKSKLAAEVQGGETEQQMNSDISEAESLLIELKRRKIQLETEMDKVKKEIQMQENKEQRLKSAGNEVEKNVQKLSSRMKSFKQQAVTSNESNSSNIDKCIRFIEEYEQMNLQD